MTDYETDVRRNTWVEDAYGLPLLRPDAYEYTRTETEDGSIIVVFRSSETANDFDWPENEDSALADPRVVAFEAELEMFRAANPKYMGYEPDDVRSHYEPVSFETKKALMDKGFDPEDPKNADLFQKRVRMLHRKRAGVGKLITDPYVMKQMAAAAALVALNPLPVSKMANDLTVRGSNVFTSASWASVDSDPVEESEIPSFDDSVVGEGIFKRFVDLVSRNTALPDQYAFAIAKTVVGLRMAGKVKLEGYDFEPRYYLAMIGDSGVGKGESWRRTLQIIRPESFQGHAGISPCKMKIIDSFDSGAGLKDFFFEPPESEPVLCFIDEIEDLGNKAAGTNNPSILDTIISLADSTSISRVLAKKGGKNASKTKPDARLAMIMCGQDGTVYTKALAGRTKLGLWDRFYPEWAPLGEPSDLASISMADAYGLLGELNALDYSGTIKMSDSAKLLIEQFWNETERNDRKSRWKKHLITDAFVLAFGRGSREVADDDAVRAIKIARRQIIIRKVCFTTEVPDKTGYYTGLLKKIVATMGKRLAKGDNPELVALSERDFQWKTNAHRDNEIHIFDRAWKTYAHTYLQPVKVVKPNGHQYLKYLPLPPEE